MRTFTDEDWANIVAALAAYRHNASFQATLTRVRAYLEAR